MIDLLVDIAAGVGELLHGAVVERDWRLGVLTIMLLTAFAAYSARRSRGSLAVQRDPQRVFTGAQKQIASGWCGGVCEHKPALWRRCGEQGTHGDHIYPHSKGGATSMSNLQMLCRRHNQRKSAHTPSALYMWRLSRRRLRYFPPNIPTDVVWRFGEVAPMRRPRTRQ